jgi:hypothetical protein
MEKWKEKWRLTSFPVALRQRPSISMRGIAMLRRFFPKIRIEEFAADAKRAHIQTTKKSGRTRNSFGSDCQEAKVANW